MKVTVNLPKPVADVAAAAGHTLVGAAATLPANPVNGTVPTGALIAAYSTASAVIRVAVVAWWKQSRAAKLAELEAWAAALLAGKAPAA